jgi:PAS domain S-box-containing protein
MVGEETDKGGVGGESGGESGRDAARWFFENSRDLLCVIDRKGRFKSLNPAWTAATGWAPEDLLGRSPADFVHPDDQADFAQMAARLAATGEALNFARIKLKNGAWRWFEGRNRRTAEGEVLGVLRDVQEERVRAAELAAARRDQAMLSEAAGIGTWTYEPKEDRIDWSSDVLALFGWAAEDIDTPVKFLAILDPDQAEDTNQAFTRGVELGEGATIEHRLRAADGRWLTMRATFRTERRGRMFALKGISQDVTELAAARDAALRGQQRVTTLAEELTANAVRLKMALNAAEAGAFEIDHAAQTFWASDRFYELVGRQMVYAEVNLPIWPFVHPDDQTAVIAGNIRWASGDTAEPMEFRVIHLDGRERWVRVFYAIDSATRRAVGLVLDIDARKRQELALVAAERQALAASEAKARFLANMSHELRTPMNGVLGVMHLLEREPLSEDGRQMLDEALGCGRMLTALLDDVIDFSRIEAGKLDLAAEPVDIQALVEGVARVLGPQAEGKGIELSVEGARELGWALADGVRLRQALFNLVGNAVKFTPSGGVAVRCARQNNDLVFEIEDTGVGIPLEAQAGLFERFHQADASTTRQFGGSGLGLAITHRLAELMGGTVGFVSEPGHGSTFTLRVHAPAALAPAPAAAVPDGVLAGLSVLVVEDNPTNRMIAVKLLETLGAAASTAHEGLDGVERARTGAYDLILMDIQMPGIDGVEAARRIRALGGEAGRTPIIALTANVMAHQTRAYREAGMDGVVSKPLSPAALLAEIARLSAETDVESDAA